MNIIKCFHDNCYIHAEHSLAIFSSLVAGFIIKEKPSVLTGNNSHIIKDVLLHSFHVNIKAIITGPYGSL